MRALTLIQVRICQRELAANGLRDQESLGKTDERPEVQVSCARMVEH